MSSLLAKLEAPLMKLAGKLGQQPHLNAIRDGVVGALPLVLIGSLFLLLGQPPMNNAQMEWYTKKVIVWGFSPALRDTLFPAVIVALLVLVLGGLIVRAVLRSSTRARVPLALLTAVVTVGLTVTVVGSWLPAIRVAAASGPWLTAVTPLFLLFLTVFRVLVKLIGIYVAFGVAYGLARRYSLDSLSAGLLSVAALLLCNGLNPDKSIPTLNIGPDGLFLAIILGLLVPEAQRFARDRKLEITMPDGVPPAVGRSFSALLPGLLVIVPIWLLVHVCGVNLFSIISIVFTAPILAVSKSGAGLIIMLLVVILIDSVLWLLGVHAVAILAPMAAIWTANMLLNGTAVDNHQLPMYLNTRETMQFFIWVGGSGATVALPWLLLRAKSAGLRAIAKVGLIPSLFNVNEPLIFGVPVMMNPTLVIPFILAPLVTMALTVFAISNALVPVPSLIVPWTLPGPIGAFLATGGAWQAAVLSLVNIALAALIYWPFVKMLDKRMVEAEAEANPEPVASA